MRKIFIIGNWKSHNGIKEASEWIEKIANSVEQMANGEKEKVGVICPPFTLLYFLKSNILRLSSSLKLGAQNVSPFEEGAYTGEESAKQIKEFADYVIIGHSERRKYFNETDDILSKKVSLAKQYDLKVIYCVSSIEQPIPKEVDIVAYEPLFAIGTGNPETPEKANEVAKLLKEKKNITTVIYGGSVTAENISSFTNMPFIDGVLPGGASLDPLTFSQMIKNA